MQRLILLILFFCLIATGCSSGWKTQGLQEVEQDVILYTQSNPVYDYVTLKETVAQNPSLTVFCETFNITQYKVYKGIPDIPCKTTEGAYMVSFHKDESHDPPETECVAEKINFSPLKNKNNIELLTKGQTVDDVRNADPNGQYVFISSSGLTDADQLSLHCFESGEIFFFAYNYEPTTNTYVIADIFRVTF